MPLLTQTQVQHTHLVITSSLTNLPCIVRLPVLYAHGHEEWQTRNVPLSLCTSLHMHVLALLSHWTSLKNTSSKLKLVRISRWGKQSSTPSPEPTEHERGALIQVAQVIYPQSEPCLRLHLMALWPVDLSPNCSLWVNFKSNAPSGPPSPSLLKLFYLM